MKRDSSASPSEQAFQVARSFNEAISLHQRGQLDEGGEGSIGKSSGSSPIILVASTFWGSSVRNEAIMRARSDKLTLR